MVAHSTTRYHVKTQCIMCNRNLVGFNYQPLMAAMVFDCCRCMWGWGPNGLVLALWPGTNWRKSQICIFIEAEQFWVSQVRDKWHHALDAIHLHHSTPWP